jgi:hypothetical protein
MISPNPDVVAELRMMGFGHGAIGAVIVKGSRILYSKRAQYAQRSRCGARNGGRRGKTAL